MKKVLRIDGDGIFLEDVILEDDEVTPEDCIETEAPEGLHLPKWNGTAWVEGKVATLGELKAKKASEVAVAYQVELNGTFTSEATGTALVYDFSPNSQNLWKELSDSIVAGYVPDTLFPMNITLANGTVVQHTKAQLQQIFGEITLRKLSLYGKYQNLMTSAIPWAKTESEVQAITW